jgi:glycosyltransferase involved in cell wall biosynthesis
VANSDATQKRISTYWGRDSSVIYPPVETTRFAPGEVGDYYLVLSELMPHKRIATAVEAFNRLGRPLVVVGDGPDARRLRRLAGPNVRLLGRVDDEHVAQLLSGCRALIVTANEEFGIAAVEAQAAGRPVIGLAAGGVCETMVEGRTGTFWAGGPAELAEAVERFDDAAIDPQACLDNAARYDTAKFQRRISREVDQFLGESDGRQRHGTRRALQPSLARRGLVRRRY